MSAQLAKLKRIAIFLATIFSASISGMVHADWSIKGLGFLGEWASHYSQSAGTDINDSGQVVGDSFTASGSRHAFITGPNGIGMTDLGTLGGENSSAGGINNSGQIVGDSFTASGSRHAFITGPNGIGMTDLGTFGGFYSIATGINDAGEVVGVMETAHGEYHSFRGCSRLA